MTRLASLIPTFLLVCIFYVLASAVEEQKAAASPALTVAQIRLQHEAQVEKINRSQKKWTAKLHPHFGEMSRDEQRRWLGLRRDPAAHKPTALRKRAKREIREPLGNGTDPYEAFDARKRWPECADVIGRIPDQSGCGSCWAVSSASVMQDRICIASGGKMKVNISAEDIMSCEKTSYGCEGGYPDKAFEFWQTTGVCTGGGYESKQGCKPYPFPHHAKKMYDTPRCKKWCENRTYRPRYKKDKHYGLKPVSLVDAMEEDIMDAIMEGGPVEADMVVYYDFFHYSSGVYERNETSDEAGGHAVRIVGWGYDKPSDTDYWLVANSWDSDWGENGYFKIARGQDECLIESWGINFAKAKLH